MQTLASVCWASSRLGGKIAADAGSTWQEGKQPFSVLDSSSAGQFSFHATGLTLWCSQRWCGLQQLLGI